MISKNLFYHPINFLFGEKIRFSWANSNKIQFNPTESRNFVIQFIAEHLFLCYNVKH